MPSELQQNRYDQLLRRVGGLVGPGSKVSEVLTELFPTFDVENAPNELALLGGTHIGFGGTGNQGAAGETPKTQLFNPGDSGKLVTVTRFDVSVDAVAVVRYGIEQNERGAVVLTGTFADSRLGINRRTTAVVRFDSSVGLSLHSGRFNTVAGVNLTFANERGLFVLAPGTGITFNSEVLASDMDLSFFWRERVAEQSELSF